MITVGSQVELNALTHRGPRSPVAPVVVKVGGAVLEAGDAVWRHLVDLQRLAGPLVLVHGGGAQVDAHLARLGLPTLKHQGVRITPDDQIDEVVAVLAGRMNATICGLLLAAGLPTPPVGATLSAGGLVRAERAQPVNGVDLGRVGAVSPGDPAAALALLASGVPLVLSSIALDAAGRTLNVNADDAAMAVARTLHARELVFLSDVRGVLDHAGRVLDRLDRPAIDGLIASGVITAGMIPKVRAALDAADALGSPVRISSWHDPAAGTLVRSSPAATRA